MEWAYFRPDPSRWKYLIGFLLVKKWWFLERKVCMDLALWADLWHRIHLHDALHRGFQVSYRQYNLKKLIRKYLSLKNYLLKEFAAFLYTVWGTLASYVLFFRREGTCVGFLSVPSHIKCIYLRIPCITWWRAVFCYKHNKYLSSGKNRKMVATQ